ncbi:MAG TPA: hypothetical protein VEG40_07540 [Gaiellaceae bacterium]|nr:hypothetical protein [Gaiellaceae bacterium]
MKKPLRLSLIAVVGAAGLALAATALPASSSRPLAVQHLSGGPSPQAYTPSLTVQQSSYKVGAATNVGFLFIADPTADATAKFTIFSPAGYTNVLTQAPGTAIGKAFAMVRSAQLGGADLTLTGNVVVGNPADPALMAAYGQCKSAADPSTPAAVWVLNTSLQGQMLQVPAFVNQLGPYLVQEVCLTPPATTAFQAQLWIANYTINGVFKNAPASAAYSWAGDFTPYVGTTPNPAGTVEYRTYVGLPASLSFLKGTSKKASQAAFKGKLKIFGISSMGTKVDAFYSTKSKPAPNLLTPSATGVSGKGKFKSTKKLPKSGSYSLSVSRPKKKTFYQAFFGGYELTGGCQGQSPTGLPIPCLHEEIAPITGAQIAVSPAKKKHKH